MTTFISEATEKLNSINYEHESLVTEKEQLIEML